MSSVAPLQNYGAPLPQRPYLRFSWIFSSVTCFISLMHLTSHPAYAQTPPKTPCTLSSSPLPCQIPGADPFESGNLLERIPLAGLYLSINSQYPGGSTGASRPDVGWGKGVTFLGHLSANGDFVTITNASGGEVRYARASNSVTFTNENFFQGDVSTISGDGRRFVLKSPETTITYEAPFNDTLYPTRYSQNGGQKSTSILYRNGLPLRLVTAPIQRRLSFTPDSTRHITAVTDEQTRQTWRLSYNSAGFLTSITYPDQRTARFEYTADGNLASYTDADAQKTSYSYLPYNVIGSVTNSAGVKTLYTYRGTEIGASTSSSAGAVTFARMTFKKGPTDDKLRLFEVFSGTGFDWQANGILERRIERDQHGAITEETDAYGDRTQYFYRLDGQCSQPSKPEERSPVATCTVNSTGTASFAVDPTNFYRPIEARKADSKGNPLVRVAMRWQGAVIQRTTVQDGNGEVLSDISYSLTPAGVPTRLEKLRTTRLRYDSNGNVISQSGTGGSLALRYDASQRIQSATHNGLQTSFSETVDFTGKRTSTITSSDFTAQDTHDYLHKKIDIRAGRNDGSLVIRNVLSRQESTSKATLQLFREILPKIGSFTRKWTDSASRQPSTDIHSSQITRTNTGE